jgi:hypothetical protein
MTTHRGSVTVEWNLLSINDLSQPPYPAIPANELCGNLLLELDRPAEVLHGLCPGRYGESAKHCDQNNLPQERLP